MNILLVFLWCTLVLYICRIYHGIKNLDTEKDFINSFVVYIVI